ncbi:5-(carboxyamino)imidazole ribonucleotide synthase [Bacillus sp. FJAT-42376]|uniref:5-(carboxyamino)imidazole ribonucleotide synthase n=1 Tax=Bacillus sp. FJAT-42376 TaxID=2014076 RepID=UPI000F51429C|nr:5-(carboxyamino)imidazole ribonucleotide synthase [Bacillus sp. FJAT-42376]AZB41460.1 5-(carboxyamino)imidazole ribonucleotide synthase [Bacillus sp. FJAT-42376]
MFKRIVPGQTIGIIGGGQLGRMMALDAKNMGYRIAVLDPTPDCPCGQVADMEITAAYNDLDAIKQLAAVSDVITYEFENIDYDALVWLENNAYLPQGSRLLSLTQDRQTEKEAIQETGCQVAPYIILENGNGLEDALEDIGFPAVLKTCRGGYDGKGQAVIKSPDDIEEAERLLNLGKCILEKWVPFEKELSIIVTRNPSGDVKVFPAAENVHRENILHLSIVPARVTAGIEKRAKDAALKLAERFELVGTLAVEMFLTEDGEIFINELAPRPHNSGHYTMDLCETSQFEQHVRSVCDLPLGRTDLVKKGLMVNVLGEHLEAVLNNLSFLDEAALYLYGKKENKPKRKMGHVTFKTDFIEKTMEQIENQWGQ